MHRSQFPDTCSNTSSSSSSTETQTGEKHLQASGLPGKTKLPRDQAPQASVARTPLPCEAPALARVITKYSEKVQDAIHDVFRRGPTSEQSRAKLVTYLKRSDLMIVMNVFAEEKAKLRRREKDEEAVRVIQQRQIDEGNYYVHERVAAATAAARKPTTELYPTVPAPVEAPRIPWSAYCEIEDTLGRQLTAKEMATNPLKTRHTDLAAAAEVHRLKREYAKAQAALRMQNAAEKRQRALDAAKTQTPKSTQLKAATNVATIWAKRLEIIGACEDEDVIIEGDELMEDDVCYVAPSQRRDMATYLQSPAPELSYAVSALIPLFVAGGYLSRRFSASSDLPFSSKKLQRLSAEQFSTIAKHFAHLGGDPICFEWARDVRSGRQAVTRITAAAAQIILATYRERSPFFTAAVDAICEALGCKRVSNLLLRWDRLTRDGVHADLVTANTDQSQHRVLWAIATMPTLPRSKPAALTASFYDDAIHEPNDAVQLWCAHDPVESALHAIEGDDYHLRKMKKATKLFFQSSERDPPNMKWTRDVVDTPEARRRWIDELAPPLIRGPFDRTRAQSRDADAPKPSPQSAPAMSASDRSDDRGPAIATPPAPRLVDIETHPGPGPRSIDRITWIEYIDSTKSLPPVLCSAPLCFFEIDYVHTDKVPIVIYASPVPFFSGPYLPANDPDVQVFTLCSGHQLQVELLTHGSEYYFAAWDPAIDIGGAPNKAVFSVRSYDPGSSPLALRLRPSRDVFGGATVGPCQRSEGTQVLTPPLTPKRLAELTATCSDVPAPRLVCVETNPGPANEIFPDSDGNLPPVNFLTAEEAALWDQLAKQPSPAPAPAAPVPAKQSCSAPSSPAQ